MGKSFFYVALVISGTWLFLRCSSPVQQSAEYAEEYTPKYYQPDSAKIALGKELFFDKRLSYSNTISCATCHNPSKVFADHLVFSFGENNRLTNRNTPSILNVNTAKIFMWDGGVNTLEKQAIVPIQAHNEMNQSMGALMKELAKDQHYQFQAKELFGRPFDPFVLTRSLAAFERSLVSLNSKYDQYIQQKVALSTDEQKGLYLFNSYYKCAVCHQAPRFTTDQFNRHPEQLDTLDLGRFKITNHQEDKYHFKIPSLRNVALTYPYMHNGQYKDLETVVKSYVQGLKYSGNYGVAVKNSKPFQSIEMDTYYLVSFLKTLTDTSYLTSYR